MNKELPEFAQKVIKSYPEVWKQYEKLGEVVRSSKALDEKTQRLVKLGIAIGARLEGAVHSHTRKCKKAGISHEEIYHVSLLAITTIGWPAAMASMSWVNDILEELNPEKKD